MIPQARWLAVLFAAGCILPIAASAGTAAAAKPNIVYILADDLGWSDVGWHGSEIRTPHLDRLASGGARLEQFYVQPVCSPTRAAFMTGRYPMRHGLQVGVVRPWAQYGLPLEERTLPQALRQAGYQTAIAGKWHLGHFQRDYLPLRRGFDHQYGHYNGALDYFTHIRDGGFDWHRDDTESRDEGYTTTLIGNEAVRLIESHDRSRPLFLYLAFNAPHAPLQALPEYLKTYQRIADPKRRSYAAMVTAEDDQVGRIVAALAKRGMTSNTLIVFSSDNGGPLQSGATNGPLRAGKGTLYEGGVRVCAFANWPGRIEPGTVIDQPLHMVDWYPTLLKLAGVSLEPALPLDGLDIWPTLAAGKPSPHQAILLNTTPANGAIRVGDWKLIVGGDRRDNGNEELSTPARTGGTGAAVEESGKAEPLVELFNLAADPYEKSNLAALRADKVTELRARLEAFSRQAIAPKAAPKPATFRSPKVWGENR